MYFILLLQSQQPLSSGQIVLKNELKTTSTFYLYMCQRLNKKIVILFTEMFMMRRVKVRISTFKTKKFQIYIIKGPGCFAL